jgi:hypothetical protein
MDQTRDRSPSKEISKKTKSSDGKRETDQEAAAKKQSQAVHGRFRGPYQHSKPRKSWQDLSPDALRQYLAQRQKVKSTVGQLVTLNKRDPSMRQRACVYKEVYGKLPNYSALTNDAK